MTGNNHRRGSSARRTGAHPRTPKSSNTNAVHQQSSTHRPLTHRAMQAHDLNQVSLHQDPNHIPLKQWEQAQVTETSLAGLGAALPQITDHTFGMTPLGRLEASSSYPLQRYNEYEPVIDDRTSENIQHGNPEVVAHTHTNATSYANHQHPPTQTHYHSPSSSTQVQHEVSDSAYPSVYPYTTQDNIQVEEYYSSPTQTTYTCIDTSTHWGHPLSGTGTQFQTAHHSQEPYARTENRYNNYQRN